MLKNYLLRDFLDMIFTESNQKKGSMTSPNDEKRKYLRIKVDCEIHFAVLPANGAPPPVYLMSRVLDLSAGGTSFESPEKLETGEELVLKFKFKSKLPVVKLSAVVQRCAPPLKAHGLHTIGVRFLHNPKDIGPMFSKFIAANS